MSFRGRLTLFFVLIVIVPMVSLTVVLFRLISDNENGKADAKVAARFDAAINLYEKAREDADVAAVKVGRDVVLATALQRGDRPQAQRRAGQLLVGLQLKRIVVTGPTGKPVVDVGSPSATFPAIRRLQSRSGRAIGTLQVSVIGPKAYAALVRRLTGLHVVVRRPDKVLAVTLPGADSVKLPADRGRAIVRSAEYRVATFPAPGFEGKQLRVSVLNPVAGTSSRARDSRRVAALILIGFFILAFTFAVLVSRSLQRQIEGFLEAARRLGAGDFTAEVPITGRDEFAALGTEFNRMSAQLEARLEELRQEQARLANAMRRIGETFASNLDRDALLEIVLRTALDGSGAGGGRARVRARLDEPPEPVAVVGDVEALDLALAAAEAAVLESGQPHEDTVGDVMALAHPLRSDRAAETDGHPRVAGIVAIARADRPFTANERELFHYLAGQASVSVENVGLHETVERQATTDELTGLSNRRRFQETMGVEVERSRRFGQPLGLVMLDIDNFKSVNDTYGHQAGDHVLREVARILKESSREIDEPARYGGEELAVVLPGSDLDGAFHLAERVRQGIEELDLPIRDAEGHPLRITASFGAATLPASAADAPGLVAAADAALYEAKRTGKNRTVRAAGVVSG